MRHAIVLLFLIPNLLKAQAVLCGDNKTSGQDLLSQEQWHAVLDQRANGDVLVEESIAVEERKVGHKHATEAQLINIDWNQAKKLILVGSIVRIAEHANRSLAMVSVSGKRYASSEPEISEVWRVTRVVDPCGVYIEHVLE